MTRNPTPPLAAFFADLRGPEAVDEWRGNWAIALLYRRPGIIFAFLAGRAGLTPIAITLTGLVLALSLPLQAAALPLGMAAWAVFASGALFQMLDCADGTLARVTGQASRLGGDLDFLTDMAQWAMLYAAIGLLADRSLDTEFAWTALALGAAWARLMARVIRDRLRRDEAVPGTEPKTGDAPHVTIMAISGLSGVFAFFALAGPALPWAVGFLLVYAILDIGDSLAPLVSR